MRWGPEEPWEPTYGAWLCPPPSTPQLSLQSGNQGTFKPVPVGQRCNPHLHTDSQEGSKGLNYHGAHPHPNQLSLSRNAPVPSLLPPIRPLPGQAQ